MHNFQKLSETTSLRCNNSSENSVPKRDEWLFFRVATESNLNDVISEDYKVQDI
jgi:hypothetical protein